MHATCIPDNHVPGESGQMQNDILCKASPLLVPLDAHETGSRCGQTMRSKLIRLGRNRTDEARCLALIWACCSWRRTRCMQQLGGSPSRQTILWLGKPISPRSLAHLGTGQSVQVACCVCASTPLNYLGCTLNTNAAVMVSGQQTISGGLQTSLFIPTAQAALTGAARQLVIASAWHDCAACHLTLQSGEIKHALASYKNQCCQPGSHHAFWHLKGWRRK